MADLIDRQAAIDALKNRWKKTRNYEGIGDDIAEECELYLKQVPSAQSYSLNEWCTDCKEYNHEKHCCPRFNKVIRTALQDAQPETAKRIVGKSRDGMTLWYQCDMCNEPVDVQDIYCRGCGRRLIDEQADIC